MRWVARVLIVILMTAGLVSGQEELTTRVFTLEHRDVIDAVRMIQHVLSDEGSLQMRPTERRLTVQDRPEVMEQVALMLENLDVPPYGCTQLLVRLIDARDNPPVEAGGSSGLEEDLLRKLRRTFHLEHYQLVSASKVEGSADDGSVTVSLGEHYVLDFRCSLSSVQRQPFLMHDSRWTRASAPVSAHSGGGAPQRRKAGVRAVPSPVSLQRVSLKGLTLLRREVSTSGGVAFQEILRTNLALAPGQRVVLGAMSSEGAGRALVLVIELPVSDDGEV